MRFRLSKAATQDVEEAWLHTAWRWSPERADALLDTFEDKFRNLARYPNSGRRRDELAPGLRSLTVSGFVVIYRTHDETLEIVRVVHGTRDLHGLLARDEPPDASP